MARSVYVMALVLAACAAAARADDAPSSKRFHFLSLAEARVKALSRGGLGQPSLLFPGIHRDSLVSGDGDVSLRVAADPGAASGHFFAVYTDGRKSPRARAEAERLVNQMLLNVETAYWNLYGSYWNLHSREQSLSFAYQTWRIVKSQFDAGSKNSADLAQCRGQYELFRAQRLQALDVVVDNERQLRALLGMAIEDGTRLVPCDAPKLSAYKPDWKTSLDEALARRPELAIARQEVKANRDILKLAKNALLPDLRFTATYDSSGTGKQTDGSAPTNALRQPAIVAVGFRAAHDNVRAAKLQLLRSQVTLQEQEMKAERFLGLQFRRLASYHEQIRAQRAQREAYGEQLKARHEDFIAERKSLDILLEAQRFYADALANEYAAITSYNNARCCFAYAKGTILEYAHITLTDSPPADSCRVQAAASAHQQAVARVARAKPVPTCSHLAMPKGACSLPALWKSMPPLKNGGDLAAPEEWKAEDLFPVEASTEE